MRISDWSSDVCSSDLTTARHSPDLPPERRGKRSPPVVWSALRSGLRPSLRSDQTTDPTGHHSRRSTSHRSCRRAGTATPGMGYNHDISPVQCIRSEEHTSELQSLMRISYSVFCLTKKNT